jgi:hypothetical protein
MVGMDKPQLHIQCYDCKARYDLQWSEGVLWPPAICGACGSDRIIVGCCREPKLRGGRCDNCGQWSEDAFGD